MLPRPGHLRLELETRLFWDNALLGALVLSPPELHLPVLPSINAQTHKRSGMNRRIFYCRTIRYCSDTTAAEAMCIYFNEAVALG